MERLVRSLRVPFVGSSLSEGGQPASRKKLGEIRTNSVAIAGLAASYLMGIGFRHFAFCGFDNCPWSLAREKAFVRATEKVGNSCSVHHIALANWMQSPDWMKSWLREQPMLAKWLQTIRKPAGVMACNDSCGREVLQACRDAGIRVPDDVAVLGVDNDEMMCELSNPPLSSLALNLEKAGYEAARLLRNLMNGNSVKSRLVWVEPTHVVPRLSTDVIAQEDNLVAEALRFIRNRAREPISVSDVTREVRVSRRTLERRFLRALGRPLLSEITRCHMQRAKQLLLETDLPCYEIALESGFGSLKTFHRTFNLQEKTTPDAFRRRFGSVRMRPVRNSLHLTSAAGRDFRRHRLDHNHEQSGHEEIGKLT